jgi:hypothetical protein
MYLLNLLQFCSIESGARLLMTTIVIRLLSEPGTDCLKTNTAADWYFTTQSAKYNRLHFPKQYKIPVSC